MIGQISLESPLEIAARIVEEVGIHCANRQFLSKRQREARTRVHVQSCVRVEVTKVHRETEGAHPRFTPMRVDVEEGELRRRIGVVRSEETLAVVRVAQMLRVREMGLAECEAESGGVRRARVGREGDGLDSH